MSRGHNSPNVTVVTIFLNAEAFIAEAIESVLAQTYRDFELILVDDGSTDDSTAVAKAYASRHPDLVRYTEHQGHRNLGMSASRNHGVAMGRGRLVSFLDADDLWLPERLRRYVSAIEAYPEAGMLYGPTLYWYSWATANEPDSSGTEEQDFPGQLDLPTETLIQPPEPLRRWLESAGGSLPGMGSLIVRREAFDGVHGFETEFRGLYEDQAFLSKIAAMYSVVVLPEVLDYYRQHPGSCCRRGMETGDYHPVHLHPARRRYLFWLDGYCRDNGIVDRAVLRALRRELWPYRSRIGGFLYTAKRTAADRIKGALRRWLPLAARNRLRSLRNKLKAMDAWLRGTLSSN
jgi:glycosyltransferase involved in cell wall biosynthesis